MRLHLVKPCLQRDKRLGSETEQSNACILSRPVIADEPMLQENTKMPAHRRRRRAGGLGQLARSLRTFTKELHHATARAVSERFKTSF